MKNFLKKIFIAVVMFLSFTSSTLAAESLSLEGVIVEDTRTLELTFNSSIDESEDLARDFKINSSETGEEIIVDESIVDKERVYLLLKSDLLSGKDYEMVVISLSGIDGSTIANGADGFSKFTIPEFSESTVSSTVNTTTTNNNEIVNTGEDTTQTNQPVSNQQDSTQNNEAQQGVAYNNSNVGDLAEDIVELNAASSDSSQKAATDSQKSETMVQKSDTEKPDTEKEQITNENLAGKNIELKGMDKNVDSVAAKTTELAETGPEHFFLIFLALLFGFLLLKLRKTSTK